MIRRFFMFLNVLVLVLVLGLYTAGFFRSYIIEFPWTRDARLVVGGQNDEILCGIYRPINVHIMDFQATKEKLSTYKLPPDIPPSPSIDFPVCKCSTCGAILIGFTAQHIEKVDFSRKDDVLTQGVIERITTNVEFFDHDPARYIFTSSIRRWYHPKFYMGRSEVGQAHWQVKSPGVVISIPYLVIPLAAWPIVTLVSRFRIKLLRQKKGQCVSCGYDLTGNTSGVCPECGARVNDNSLSGGPSL